MKVFLGGTCNNSKWRDALIPKLKLDYFNPVLEDAKNWDEKKQKAEKREKEKCDFFLYVITPKMSGVYSIAEAVDDSNKNAAKTLFCVLDTDGDDRFNEPQLHSLAAVKQLIAANGGKVCDDLNKVAEFLNSYINKRV